MAQPKRRISYIIPTPAEWAPRLQLPPHGAQSLGATTPLLKRYEGTWLSQDSPPPVGGKHPRHRLGVASLSLDTSTQLVGRNSPGGILYSGGKDGMVMSWDLGITMKRRKSKETVGSDIKRSRWETMTGWNDDFVDDDLEDGDERPLSDGDVLGDVTSTLTKRRQRAAGIIGGIPLERRWETDMASFEAGRATHFRQSAQAHSDWVNDILLCNSNQTVISASSDGTVKSWNPHTPTPTDPVTLGVHSDYVRCLTHCREQNWVASGSFDRTIKLWDLGRSSTDALVTLNPPDSTGPKSSVYALASDPFGHTIASGSPERVIRLWDPRTGKRTGKLVGHTDNIRAILISEDSNYLLTGSADASIKLWSLRSQRCLHTFTHHTESVWSLHSTHPSLEVFYSGDRSGLVCRVDVEDCMDISEGECILLCNDSSETSRASSEGINKIMVMDDNLLWTASGTSTIRRWAVPSRRSVRMTTQLSPLDSDGDRLPVSNSPVLRRRLAPLNETHSEASTRPSTGQGQNRRLSFAPSVQSLNSEHWKDKDDRDETKLCGIPYDSMIKLVSPNDPFVSYTSTRTRDPDVATLYSAASVMSVPRQSIRSPQQNSFPAAIQSSPLHSSRTDETMMVTSTARHKYEDREWAVDAIPFSSEPETSIPGDHGLVRSIILNDRVHVLTVDTAGEVAVWDIIRGVCLGRFISDDVAAASHAGSTVGGVGGSGERERSPREALEVVRERIEGEAAVSTWCAADTKGGVLTIHLNERCFEAEVYADEVGFAHDVQFTDESKLNLGKWILRNLFVTFILEEQRLRQSNTRDVNPPTRSAPTSDREPFPHRTSTNVLSNPESSTTNRGTPGHSVTCSPTMVPAIVPIISTLPQASPLITPLIPIQSHLRDSVAIMPSIPQSPTTAPDTSHPPIMHIRTRSGTIDGSSLSPSSGLGGDYFSTQRARQVSLHVGTPATPDDFSGWTGPSKNEPPTPSTPGGLMSRLKSLGKLAKRPVSEVSTGISSTPAAEVATVLEDEKASESTKTPVQEIILNSSWAPPSSADAPLHGLPADTVILIAEEASPSYTTLYRGILSTVHSDVDQLEDAMPLWLVRYLFMNEIPSSAPLAKVSFVLMPWNKDPDMEPLPELLNTTQSKLTASRYLRVRKIVNHVQDKLEKLPSHSTERVDETKIPRPRAEDVYEVLCNETLLPLHMTLAAVRQYVWKQSAELVLHYRKRRIPHQLRPRKSNRPL